MGLCTPGTMHGIGYPFEDHAWDGISIQGPLIGWDIYPGMMDIDSGTTHGMRHASRGPHISWGIHPGDDALDRTSIQGPRVGWDIHLGTTHQLGQPFGNHTWAGTFIQGPCAGRDINPRTTYHLGHPSMGPHVGWDTHPHGHPRAGTSPPPPRPYGVGDSLSRARRRTAECPTPRSLFSLQETREYEVSI